MGEERRTDIQFWRKGKEENHRKERKADGSKGKERTGKERTFLKDRKDEKKIKKEGKKEKESKI